MAKTVRDTTLGDAAHELRRRGYTEAAAIVVALSL